MNIGWISLHRKTLEWEWFDDHNTFRIFVTLLLIANHKDKKWKGEWVFGIYNAYNRKNAASITFSRNSETFKNEATRTSIFGIMPGITYNFKF